MDGPILPKVVLRPLTRSPRCSTADRSFVRGSGSELRIVDTGSRAEGERVRRVRMQNGFWKSMGDAVGNEALAQVNGAHEMGARNGVIQEKANEYSQTGTDQSKHRIEGYLDI
jgi:hypothetical protein